MNRRVLVNTALGAAMGVALAVLGYTYTTWQYWLIFGIFLAAVVNSLIEGRHE